MPQKLVSWPELVSEVGHARSVAFGGGGLSRKPMAAAAAIGVSDVDAIEAVCFLGGPEIDLLAGLGKLAHLTFAFVGFDSLGLAPNFRTLRETGKLSVTEYSESALLTGLEAAAKSLPFLPTKSMLGTDLLGLPNVPYQAFACPLTGTPLVAVPPLRPDVAVIHVNVADRRGNGVIVGDVFADNVLARAARSVILTAEKVVDRIERAHIAAGSTLISRLWVTAVCEAPGGAGFTAMYPDYPADITAARSYLSQSKSPDWLYEFAERGAK